MKPADLVKRLRELGLRPSAYFPPERLGIPVVSVFAPRDDLNATVVEALPKGFKLEEDYPSSSEYFRLYWLNAEWDREYGKEPSDASRR